MNYINELTNNARDNAAFDAVVATREVCLGCGRKFATPERLATHQDTCPRYKLECARIKAQHKLSV